MVSYFLLLIGDIRHKNLIFGMQSLSLLRTWLLHIGEFNFFWGTDG